MSLDRSNWENRAEGSEYRKIQWKSLAFLLFLIILLLISILLSLRIGSYDTPMIELVKGLIGQAEDPNINLIISNNRLPRLTAAIITGAGLGLAGCVLQVILNNPLASASTLGVTQGATFGAALAIIFFNLTSPLSIYSFSFLGSVFVAIAILILSRVRKLSAEATVLAGVAISSMLTGGTTLLQYFADEVQLGNLIFWTFGDLGNVAWKDLGVMALMVVLLLIFCWFSRWDYNVLQQGEEIAISLGVNVQKTRVINMVFCCLTCSILVSRVGLINFIGLVAPHIVRLVVGNNHIYLVPGSLLAGAGLLVLSDLAARSILMPIILPIGAITSFLGGPLFLYILFREGRKHG